jgi:hypothetical protein
MDYTNTYQFIADGPQILKAPRRFLADLPQCLQYISLHFRVIDIACG